MTTVFETTVAAISVSLHGQIQNQGSSNVELIRDIARYQLLYNNMLKRMRQYLNLYTDGSYNELKQEFTTSNLNFMLLNNNDSVYYNKDVDILTDFTYDETTFNNYKKSLYAMLTGFTKSIKQNDQLVACEAELNEKRELLTSKDKLIEYITTEFIDKLSMDSFYITQQFSTTAELKPWFNLYLQTYGAPYDGVFNAEKMANVVEILVNTNVITMEYFMTGYL
jgi:hypothetical protein